jgi:two-component system cell cycle response regulator
MPESPRGPQDATTMLLIQDTRGGARAVRAALAGDPFGLRVGLEVVSGLHAGLERLLRGDIAIILLDLSLRDNRGLEAVFTLREQAPAVPVIVLTSAADQAWGVRAVAAGAEEYLVKGKLGGAALLRAVRYALERRRLRLALQQMSLVDDLSGLHNRRGFFKFADQQIKLLRRMGKRGLLVAADIQDLKGINDRYGHAAGDVAIADTAAVLKRTFRDSDVVGRLGGDEFGVLAPGVADDGPRSILRRLNRALSGYNAAPDRRFTLAFHLGFALVDPTDGSSLEHLLAEADRDLLDKKRRRVRPRTEVTL